MERRRIGVKKEKEESGRRPGRWNMGKIESKEREEKPGIDIVGRGEKMAGEMTVNMHGEAKGRVVAKGGEGRRKGGRSK